MPLSELSRLDEISKALSCIPTIVFLNKSFENPTPAVWVCESQQTYENCLQELKKKPHIEIIQSGMSNFVAD